MLSTFLNTDCKTVIIIIIIVVAIIIIKSFSLPRANQIIWN